VFDCVQVEERVEVDYSGVGGCCHTMVRLMLARVLERGDTTMIRLTMSVRLRCSRPVTIEPIMESTSTNEEFISGASGP
jgi:hypothetical protein